VDQHIQATVDAAIAGDRRAFDSLFARNLPRLEAFVRRNGGAAAPRDSVSDLVQSICREALQDLGDFDYRGEEAFRSWLFRRAAHKIVDRLRYHHRARRDLRREVAPDATGPGTRDGERLQPAHELTPSRHASAREQLARLERMLTRLPEHQREAIGLVRVLGLDYATVAARMGRSEAAVRNLVARGLATIAGLLEDG
jgi:RNA polymerase sigma-70 factor (ECF subfamily)